MCSVSIKNRYAIFDFFHSSNWNVALAKGMAHITFEENLDITIKTQKREKKNLDIKRQNIPLHIRLT